MQYHNIILYGSLMSLDEIKKEFQSIISKSQNNNTNNASKFENILSRIKPVNVYNYRRIFNKVATRGVWETEEDKRNNRIAVLNIESKKDSYFNAIAIKLRKNEYEKLIKREIAYKIIKLNDVRDYNMNETIKEDCYAFISKNKDNKPNIIIKKNILPVPKYFNFVLKEVKKLNSKLGIKGMDDKYLETTYMYKKDKEPQLFILANLKDYEKK